MQELTERELERHYQIEAFFGENRKKAIQAMTKIALDYLRTELSVSEKEAILLEAYISDVVGDMCREQQDALELETMAEIENRYESIWSQQRRKSWALDAILSGLKPEGV